MKILNIDEKEQAQAMKELENMINVQSEKAIKKAAAMVVLAVYY